MASELIKIQEELASELADPTVVKALIDTTFKGLPEPVMRKAMLEGMIRGFKFRDFLERKVYAIPFTVRNEDGTKSIAYSLVTSIDEARSKGTKGGVIGIDAPVYGEDQLGQWCSVIVKKKVNGEIGEFVGKVYFKEYTTAKNLWISKPLTMIAKVAEMHALRKACPEELAQAYTEEEVEAKNSPSVPVLPKGTTVDVEACNQKLMTAKNLDELKTAWDSLTPAEMHNEQVMSMKKSLKNKFEIPNINENPDLSGE